MTANRSPDSQTIPATDEGRAADDATADGAGRAGTTAEAARPQRASRGQDADAARSADALSGKVHAPSAPVDVPRQPAKPDAGTPDAAGQASDPPADPDDESNWADSSKPRPNAKNARSHLF